MNKLFQEKAFKLGFTVSMFFTAGLNLIIVKLVNGSPCHGCYGKRRIGIPFRFYEDFNIARQLHVNIVWSALAADLLFALAVSFLAGLIFKFAWARISSPPLYLK